MGDDRARNSVRSRLPSVVGEATPGPLSAASTSQSERRARFRVVYDANYYRVLGYVLRRAATREDADDVVAETFLTAWRRLEQVPPGTGARPWLYAVARNALANRRRAERRRGRLTGRLHSGSVQPSHPVDADEEVAWVAAAFARLSDDDRELLRLAVWEGLDPGEIATVLECSRNAARIPLHRARRRLARELKDDDVEAARSAPGGGASARSLIPVQTERER